MLLSKLLEAKVGLPSFKFIFYLKYKDKNGKIKIIFCALHFVNMFGQSIRTSLQNMESVENIILFFLKLFNLKVRTWLLHTLLSFVSRIELTWQDIPLEAANMLCSWQRATCLLNL